VLSERLVRGIRDPLPGFVTIREVEVNRDFTRAKVFFSVIGTDEDREGAQAALDRSRGELRREVGKQIRLRNTPELVFVLDETGERAARVHEALNELDIPEDPDTDED
jgi:ribosome-binding factor A